MLSAIDNSMNRITGRSTKIYLCLLVVFIVSCKMSYNELWFCAGLADF